MYNERKTDEEIELEAQDIIIRLKHAGIILKKGDKTPLNGKYTNIINHGQGILKVNLND
ncbi:hypothetical protein [Virgibacillus halodenitrificans]|uniref:hypothetical protein n=1 Tax=Virgibacillus halodenitrificans TaxID=1482 RepID=UPI0013CEDBE4|nr:hypothetical protein [Virgibacillus halodenitrificans]